MSELHEAADEVTDKTPTFKVQPFYNQEMEVLRQDIIELLQSRLEFLSGQHIYYVLHPIAEEFKIMYQSDLAKQFYNRASIPTSPPESAPTSAEGSAGMD